MIISSAHRQNTIKLKFYLCLTRSINTMENLPIKLYFDIIEVESFYLQFTWLLDAQPIIDVSSLHRYAIGQYVDISGDVISHLNISQVRTDDGGLYKCVATNSMGSVEHSARLNVFGKSNGCYLSSYTLSNTYTTYYYTYFL